MDSNDAKRAKDLEDFLERLDRESGIDQLRVVAQVDLPYAKAQHELFRAAAYTEKAGGLSRMEKELIWLAVECAYQMNTEWIRLHMKAALKAGATPLQILEAMEVASIPRGFPSVSVALGIFKEVTGSEAKHGS
jgi:alkylhydroperoxidase/carboxymuconolactone decarboxylase family protein YurZ